MAAQNPNPDAGGNPSGAGNPPPPVVPPPASPATPATPDQTLENLLLQSLQQGGGGGSVGNQQIPITPQASSGIPPIAWIGGIILVGLVVYFATRKRGG